MLVPPGARLSGHCTGRFDLVPASDLIPKLEFDHAR